MASAAEQLAANLNFKAFGKATELKQRIWFTLAALVVYRVGTYIPLPGIDPVALAQAFDSASTGLLGLFNVFAGGAVGRMAIFALGIMPYISASIIIQLNKRYLVGPVWLHDTAVGSSTTLRLRGSPSNSPTSFSAA